MRDIYITVRQQKREIKYFLICLMLAISVNIYAIIKYDTAWKELYSQWFYVLALTIFFYFVIGIFRIIIGKIWKF
jgi:hypothetical protein